MSDENIIKSVVFKQDLLDAIQRLSVEESRNFSSMIRVLLVESLQNRGELPKAGKPAGKRKVAHV